MSEFTKGPWAIEKTEESNGWHSVGPVTNGKIDVMITIFGNTGRPNSEANAHLISAAPDMYEALKKLLYIAECFIPIGEADDKFDAAKQALAKAEGK